MTATGTATVREYAALLEGDADEARRLAEDLTINVTSFFRDDVPFRVLEQIVIPDVLERRRTDGVRIWVPACSSGEEAYSLAMLFCERGDELPRPPQIQVFATDIDASALAEARRGQYTSVVERQVSPERLARFFTKRGDSYSVTKPLRDLCIFTEHDLVRDPPFSRMDLVSCRNLLIYLEPALQKRVIELLHYALRPGGYLLLGKAETIDARELELFEVVDKAERVFRRREVDRRPAFLPAGRRALPLELAPPSRRADPEVRSAADRSRSIVLEEYAPPSVVVDARGEIRYYWGTKLAFFLPPRAGAPSTNLMHLARRELRVELSAALHNAARQAKPVTYKDVVVEAEGVQRRLNIVVRPLPPTEQDPDELFLVVFEELQATPIAHGTPLDAPTLERHRQLQRDLESTQERLQVTIEELENTNEALRTSNEQLQAMNEEMHSSNEELQTSQEELQSVNEELNTLNAELSKKVDELELLYGDLQNLFQSTQIATIFLDRESRIARFTPAATAVFRLADGDVGRPLSDFAARFDAQDVPQEVTRVLETLAPVERTVGLADEKRSFLMRMNPYRTPSNVIAGVVVSFIDVTKLKETEAALRRAVRGAGARGAGPAGRGPAEGRVPRRPVARAAQPARAHPEQPPRPRARRRRTPARRRKAHEIIARQVGHLARLVDDLLDVTRIANGKLQVERRSMDLRELAQRTAEDHRGLFDRARGGARGRAPGRAAVGRRRRDAPRAGDREPAPELGQVHLQRRLGPAVARGGGRLRGAARPGHRRRHRPRDDPAALPAVLAGRHDAQPPPRRARARPRAREGARRDARRHDRGVERRQGRGRRVRRAAAARGGAGPDRGRAGCSAAAAPAPHPRDRGQPRRRREPAARARAGGARGGRRARRSPGDRASPRARSRGGALRHRAPGHGRLRGREGAPRASRASGTRSSSRSRGYALPEDQRRAAEAGFDAHLTKPATVEGVEEVMSGARQRRGRSRARGRSWRPASLRLALTRAVRLAHDEAADVPRAGDRPPRPGGSTVAAAPRRRARGRCRAGAHPRETLGSTWGGHAARIPRPELR